jgi:hypothetical protein
MNFSNGSRTYNFNRETSRRKDHLEDLVTGRIVYKNES